VGLDRRQRAAQLVGGVAGQPAFAFDGLGDALEQLVLRLHQRQQLRRQTFDRQGFEGVGAASGQCLANPAQGRQPTAQAEPEQSQAAEQSDRHWQRRRQQHRALQRGTLIQAVGRGDAQLALHQGEAAPGHAVDQLVAKAVLLGVQLLVGRTVAARQHLATQRADLAGQAVGDAQLLGAQTLRRAVAGHRLRQLHQQAGDHARRGRQALVEREHHLAAQIDQHPGRSQCPEQHEGRAEHQGQA